MSQKNCNHLSKKVRNAERHTKIHWWFWCLFKETQLLNPIPPIGWPWVTRLELPFLPYNNNNSHNKWVVCIGVLNGTSLWQAGRNPEQNRCFKMFCSEYKSMLTSKNMEMGIFQLNVLRTNIIPIINYTWKWSFAKINTNWKA